MVRQIPHPRSRMKALDAGRTRYRDALDTRTKHRLLAEAIADLYYPTERS